jgi:hypothetical protein
LRSSLLTLLGSLALISGCEGSLLGPRTERPIDPNLPAGAPRELPAPASRAPRLSHDEYENTMRDLLALATRTGVTDAFVADSTSTTFTNNGGDLFVTSSEWQDFQKAAETLAERATASESDLTALAGGVAIADAEALLRAIGRRVFRRALTDAEVDAYLALSENGRTFYPTMTPRLAGVRLVLEAMLQSPHFLYRVELSTQVTADVIPLSGPELATRLSYALWQSTPDEALLRAGEDGTLLTADGYGTQVARMLADIKARDAVNAFHAQLLGASKYADITRSTTLFPEFTVGLRDSMREEQARFIDALVFTQNASLQDLLTSPTSYVDQQLARVYGLPGTFDSTFQKVTFTDGKRGGLFTQVGFLAANSTSTESDPIHRGVFLNHKLLCAPLPAPPNVVPPLPRPDPAVPKTLRTRITEFTGPGTCGHGCHSSMINPAGFAFEHFDALGRWRDQELNGLSIDARDTYYFEGKPRAYDGAVEFGTAMAEEPMAHHCYAEHWVEFLHGRGLGEADQAVIARVGKQSWEDKVPVTTLLKLLVESESFKARAKEER